MGPAPEGTPLLPPLDDAPVDGPAVLDPSITGNCWLIMGDMNVMQEYQKSWLDSELGGRLEEFTITGQKYQRCNSWQVVYMYVIQSEA